MLTKKVNAGGARAVLRELHRNEGRGQPQCLQGSIECGVKPSALVVVERVLVIGGCDQQSCNLQAFLVIELHQLVDKGLVDRHRYSLCDQASVVHSPFAEP